MKDRTVDRFLSPHPTAFLEGGDAQRQKLSALFCTVSETVLFATRLFNTKRFTMPRVNTKVARLAAPRTSAFFRGESKKDKKPGFAPFAKALAETCRNSFRIHGLGWNGHRLQLGRTARSGRRIDLETHRATAKLISSPCEIHRFLNTAFVYEGAIAASEIDDAEIRHLNHEPSVLAGDRASQENDVVISTSAEGHTVFAQQQDLPGIIAG